MERSVNAFTFLSYDIVKKGDRHLPLCCFFFFSPCHRGPQHSPYRSTSFLVLGRTWMPVGSGKIFSPGGGIEPRAFWLEHVGSQSDTLLCLNTFTALPGKKTSWQLQGDRRDKTLKRDPKNLYSQLSLSVYSVHIKKKVSTA